MVGPGDPAPSFSLPDQHGRPVSLADFRGRPLVLYFYPKDFTPVCTKEACGFRDAAPDLARLDAVVVGVSRDSPESHAAFARTHALPFPLLSDASGEAHRAYGVKRILGLVNQRTTFVIDAKGVVRARIKSSSRADKHVRGALDALASNP